MNNPENPFTMRASEQIENNSTFLRLFGGHVLEIMSEEMFLPKVHVFLSAPGGGKTSLFRLFTPDSLVRVHTNRATEPYGELFRKLKELQVISNEKPQMLGIYLRCTKSYSDIEELNLDSNTKSKLFFSLLGARIILVALRGILELTKSSASDLDKISFISTMNDSIPNIPIFPCDGKKLYDWISDIEKKILKILDSLDHEFDSNLSTITDLDFLTLLKPENITFNGTPIVNNTFVMLDDIHVLGKSQIQNLYEKLDSSRPPIPVWLAKRKEALQFNEMISGITGRDFTFLELESTLSEKGTFKIFVKKVADLRALSSRLNVPFTECVSGSLDGAEWEPKFKKIISDIRNRIETNTENTRKYNLWLKQQENAINSSRIDGIDWKAIEILINRKEKGGQQQLIDHPLPTTDLEQITQLKPTAELFISHDYPEIPYYCELSKIINLATSNIEQFLFIAGAIFEEVIANSILKKGNNLSLERQQKVIKKIAFEYWNDIPRRIPQGENVFHLLSAFCDMARSETYRPTAPYLPGITGFGIHHNKILELINKKNQEKYPEYEILEQTLRSCLANNILTIKLDYKQGPKNSDSTVVFYLNRLICVCFDLPLGYGGFKRTNPTELSSWLKPGSKIVGSRSND